MKSSSLAVFLVLCVLARVQQSLAWSHLVCGRDLADLVGFVCNNRYYSDLSKRTKSMDHRSIRAAPFSSERDAKRFHRSASSKSSRRTGLIVTECCQNSCNYKTVESYCAYPLPGVVVTEEDRMQRENEIVQIRRRANTKRKSLDPYSRIRQLRLQQQQQQQSTQSPPTTKPRVPTTTTTTTDSSTLRRTPEDSRTRRKSALSTSFRPRPRPRPTAVGVTNRHRVVTDSYHPRQIQNNNGGSRGGGSSQTGPEDSKPKSNPSERKSNPEKKTIKGLGKENSSNLKEHHQILLNSQAGQAEVVE